MGEKSGNLQKKRFKTSYITTVISISMVLFMFGLLFFIILNANRISNYVKENIKFSVILKDNVKEHSAKQIQKSFDVKNFVKSTEYISKDEAEKSFKKDLGEDFVDFIGYNPLPTSIDVRLKAEYANPDSLVNIEKNIKQNSNIKEIWYPKNLVHLIDESAYMISFYLLIISALFLMISLVLINNTIRLSVYSKRFIINTMQLVGATKGFIRKPFMFTGIIQGLYSSFLAIALLIGFIYWLQNQLVGIISLQDYDLMGILFLIVLALGLIISLISTFFAVNKYLRLKSNDLYY